MENDFHSLVAQIQGGSTEAMATLVERHAEVIHRVVRRRLHAQMRSQFDTCDFAQIVWASFFASLDKLADFVNPRQLEAYLARMAEHKVIDACRRRMILQKNNVNRERSLDGGTPSTRFELPSNDPTPSQAFAVRDQWERMVKRLPERYREALALRAAKFTFKEIADKLEMHERTVRRIFTNLAESGPQ